MKVETLEPHVTLAASFGGFIRNARDRRDVAATVQGYVIYVRVQIDGSKHDDVSLDNVTRLRAAGDRSPTGLA